MTQPPYSLDAQRRQIVLAAILEVARHRGWYILAAHVRTNHVHIVASGSYSGKKMMNDFKAYASRALNEAGFDTPDRKRWTRGGDTPAIGHEQGLVEKVRYVVEEQGEPMAVYVAPECRLYLSQALQAF